MSEIEKMKRYIERTNLKEGDRFYMDMVQAFELVRHSKGSVDAQLEAISLAFKYGKAKGYRAAKAKVRR